MLRILKSVSARCTAGESRSTPRWWTRGIGQLACRLILTISRLLRCGVTRARPSKSSVTCVCCNGQCIAPVFGECAPNGGHLRSRTGKNSCQKTHGNPCTSRELSGPVSCDRRIRSWFAAAGIRSCVAQLAARVRICRRQNPSPQSSQRTSATDKIAGRLVVENWQAERTPNNLRVINQVERAEHKNEQARALSKKTLALRGLARSQRL